MNIVKLTDAGRQRDRNQDAVLTEALNDGEYLLAVADGMGGHAAGEVASSAALTELRQAVIRAEDRDDADHLLSMAARKADEEISSLAASNPEYEGMGTTLVAAIIRDVTVVVVNVGDSRAYTVGETFIKQITDDHSLVAEMVREGELRPNEARDHPQSNVVTQAIGTSEPIEPDTYRFELADTLLLCSDGLTAEVTDSTIQQVIADADDLEVAGGQLVDRANDNGGSDNISVILAKK